MRLELYRDLTDGENGGEWEKVLDFVDAGGWGTEDGAPLCGKPADRVITGAHPIVLMRNDKAEVQYKKASVREIHPDPGARFVDTYRNMFESAIEWIAAKGISKGCNPPANDKFCPDDAVTRAEMATFLMRALKLPVSTTDYFDDDAGSVHEASINAIAAAGITSGCGTRRFCGNDPLTRGAMAAFIVRAFKLPASGVDHFTDDDGSVFESAIDALAAAGITKGCNPPTNDRFCPNDTLTRGQMAAILQRTLTR